MENSSGNTSGKGSSFAENWDSVGIIIIAIAFTVIVVLIATNTNVI